MDGDACASVLAVSATGDAQGTGCGGAVSCVSVSGTGNATNNAPCRNFGLGCVAANGRDVPVLGDLLP